MQSFPWNGTGAPAFYCRPPHGNTFNQGSALNRGGSRTPLPRSLSAAGFVSHFPPPALGERRHRSIACRLIAVDRPAIFVVAVGQRPEPRHPNGGGGGPS